ncbi:hypothetical protein ACRAWF_40795 [Streptomyces sp. L7]
MLVPSIDVVVAREILDSRGQPHGRGRGRPRRRQHGSCRRSVRRLHGCLRSHRAA